ncbi:CoA transferase [Burkholderia pseudomallei]|uniref:CoA transferase n=1 Tax=Burkholderia pseudomallei TaxID=28450 RepID=UPI0011BA14F4|nr:CoA transferase [Burkholderia pseudomallei]TXD00657.1 CoA transferase [Burkholderia pseudomallei]
MFVDSHGRPLFFEALHEGAQCIRLNLKEEADRSIALAMCADAAIVIDSSLPGTLSRPGMERRRLRQRSPRLVYCSITGLGNDGGNISLPGHDIHFLAASGLVAALGLTPGGKLPAFPLGDIAGGVLCAEAEILAALLARPVTGMGTELTVSVTDMLKDLNVVSRVIEASREQPDGAFLVGTFPRYRLYWAANHTMLALGALEETFRHRFCDLIGQSDLVAGQFATRDQEAHVHEAAEASLLVERPHVSEDTRTLLK